jgi:hypothetical protein
MWNVNTIKLIYEVQYITPMLILNIFGLRSIGCNRTFKGSSPNGDINDGFCSNGNALCKIKGNGNSMNTRVGYALGHKTFGRGVLR